MADVDCVVDKIAQYKKYLDKYLAKCPDENKVLYVFKKLSRLAINLDHLQTTGIGKTVNGFRKHEGSIGERARALVSKWKSLVASEAPSIKCETVSTTNYHKAGTSDENVRAPYIDAPIRKAPYMEQTNLNNSVKRVSNYEVSERSCDNNGNSSFDVNKVKVEKLDGHPSSQENKKHVKDETGTKSVHGRHDRHRKGDHHGKHAESTKDFGKVKEEKQKDRRGRDKNHHKSSSHTRTAAVDLGIVKQEKVDLAFLNNDLPNLECQQHVKKEGFASINHTPVCVDLGRVKHEANGCGSETPSPKKSGTSDKHKSHGNVDACREESKDRHHKRSKEKHRHSSNKGSSEKVHKHKTRDAAIDDCDKNLSLDSPHENTYTKIKKNNTHDMSDVDDDDNGNIPDRPKVEEIEDEKTDRFKGSSHARCRKLEGDDSPDYADNSGMSFDDFLNYDATSVKLNRKNKKTSPAEVNKKTSSAVKKTRSGHKSHSSSSQSKHSDHKHRSKVKAASSSGSHSKDGGKLKKRTVEEFAIPQPKKQVQLTPDDIISTLPETNPNYRPLPQFRPDSPTRHAGSNFNSQLIGSKTHTRTQVYSGRRQVFLTAVPTLFDACIKVLIDNIDALDYVGGVPYDILQPVLEKCSPNQLYHLEDCNPAFLTDTDVLWQHHCHQEFKGAQPDEFESWRELYLKRCDEREAKLKSLTARISASMAKKAEPVRKTRLAYVDAAVKPPREVRRSQVRHGTAGPTKGLDPLYKLSSHGGIQAPRTSLHHTDPTASQHRRATKIVAPMMAKSLKLMKGWRRK